MSSLLILFMIFTSLPSAALPGSFVAESSTKDPGRAVAGQAIEKKITEQDGLEITIEMDNGRVIAIVQAATVDFTDGERVRVLTGRGDHARVLKIQ